MSANDAPERDPYDWYDPFPDNHPPLCRAKSQRLRGKLWDHRPVPSHLVISLWSVNNSKTGRLFYGPFIPIIIMLK